MIKDITTVTTYKFTSYTPKSKEQQQKDSKQKTLADFKFTKDTKKRLNVRQYRVTDVLGK